MNLTKEIWMELDDYGYDYYQVSNTGKVRSVDRVVVSKAGQMQPFIGKELKLRNNKKEPHLFFEVSKIENDKKVRKTIYIHKVVAEIFLPKNNEKKIYVTHLDGNYNNNHLENLEWITHKQLMSRQPMRLKNPNKSWNTRRKLYGKTGAKSKQSVPA